MTDNEQEMTDHELVSEIHRHLEIVNNLLKQSSARHLRVVLRCGEPAQFPDGLSWHTVKIESVSRVERL